LTLYRHRNEVLWTNTELFLLRGFQNILTTIGIESTLGSKEWFSQALALNNLRLYAFGQVRFENQGARLNWLLPLGFTERDPLPELLDNLAMEAGLRGAKFMLASARVDNCLFETLRRGGYCLNGWQSVWDISQILGRPKAQQAIWFKPDSSNALELTSIQRKLLSPATQSVSALALQTLPDFALKIDGAVKGYARVSGFNNKVMIAPVFMNTVEDTGAVLAALVNAFFSTADKVYLLQTADTGWLTAELENLGSQATPREELLVKHFAAMQKLPSAELNHGNIGHRTDTVTPMMPSAGSKDNI
jgi:hypothetical protein